MSAAGDFGNPLRKFKLVFLGEQSGKSDAKVKNWWDVESELCSVGDEAYTRVWWVGRVINVNQLAS